MTARDFIVTFNTDVYDSRPWFQVPRAVARLLGVKSRDTIAVDIKRTDGTLIYYGLAKLDSGTEVYDAHISRRLTRGEKIRVTVSLAPNDTSVEQRKAAKRK